MREGAEQSVEPEVHGQRCLPETRGPGEGAWRPKGASPHQGAGLKGRQRDSHRARGGLHLGCGRFKARTEQAAGKAGTLLRH